MDFDSHDCFDDDDDDDDDVVILIYDCFRNMQSRILRMS
jgi:hypothetical protein